MVLLHPSCLAILWQELHALCALPLRCTPAVPCRPAHALWSTFSAQRMRWHTSCARAQPLKFAMRMCACVTSCPPPGARQGAVVREFFAIARTPAMDQRLPGFRAQQWYFFLVSTFYLYGRCVKSAVLHGWSVPACAARGCLASACFKGRRA